MTDSTGSTASQNKRIRKHFSTNNNTPRCGRQLSRPGSTTANQQSMQLTSDPLEVKCRHCLRAMGLLAPVTRAHEFAMDEAQDSDDLEGLEEQE